MKSKLAKMKALGAQNEKNNRALSRQRAYEELFLLESGRFLLGEMKDPRNADGCIGVFDEFFIECAIPRRLAPALALEICRQAQAEKVSLPLFPKFKETAPSGICFVKNRFAEEVLPLFEEETALYYAESFEEACALVADGTRDGCLVPFMGEDRLPLSGIVRLIDEYDLKKCRRYLIDNGNQNTVYLLLCKEAHLLPDADTMELLVEGVREQIDRLLALSEDCRLKVSLPEPLQGLSSPASRSASTFCRFTLQGEKEDLLLFAAVAALCLDHCTVAGLYGSTELIEE